MKIWTGRWNRLAHTLYVAVICAAPLAQPAHAELTVPSHVDGVAPADVYSKADGDVYYSAAFMPNGARPKSVSPALVVLFDTSASQIGAIRDKGLDSLNAMLASLPADTRVQLTAVDLDAYPLTRGFVAPRSAEMNNAIAQLKARVPLGSTDMEAAVKSGLDNLASASGERSIVYIGDGVSNAMIFGSNRLKSMVDRSIAQRTSIHSFAVGPRVDSGLLGALAAQTGGNIAIDDDAIAARAIGAFLTESVTSPVVWPVDVKLAEGLGETLPQHLSPLRYDRESVLVGHAGAAPAGAVSGTFEVQGNRVEMKWDLKAAASSDDNSYLSEVTNLGKRDAGLSLPLVGTAGLRTLRTLVHAQAHAMARLGQQAAVTGNTEQAKRLTAEALRLDATEPEAAAVRAALERGVDPAATGKRDLRLVKFNAEEPVAPGAAKADDAPAADAPANPAEVDAEFLKQVNENRAAFAGKVQAEVTATLRAARGIMATDPDQAADMLRLKLEEVRRAQELPAEVRMQLNDQLESALRETRRQKEAKDQRDIQRAAADAEAEQRAQLNREIRDFQNRKSQLMERFNSLLDERAYQEASVQADEIRQNEPQAGAPFLSQTQLTARQTYATNRTWYVQYESREATVATLNSVVESSIPTPDEPSVIYPDPDSWRLLTERRKKYKNVDLAQSKPNEVKIINALDEPTELEFIEAPLTDVIDFLKNKHKIEIQLDRKALEGGGVATDTPITRNLRGISLRSALRLMLRELELTYVIRDEVLLITTKTEADTLLTTKVYPVADLVIPIRVTNPLQGGLGGGMGGGIGGAGGGGMGGGGMGGGMGGMGGGGGGGFFDVKDDLKLGPKTAKTAVAPAKPAAPQAPVAVQPAAKPAQPAVAGPAVPVKPIELNIAKGANADAIWNEYFSSHEESPAVVRETVRRLMIAGHADQVIAIINAALRNNQAQPWMYEALGLAMQANGALPQDIERALMSAVDLANRPSDLLFVAEYMVRTMPGNRPIEQRALKLFRQASELEPQRSEPLVQGLALAQRLNDIEGIRWSTVGILSQAWPKSQHQIPEFAQRVAQAAYEQLRAEKKTEEAAAFKADIEKAAARDCVVVVSWSGDADIDLLVEEPTGAVCSFRNPRTTGGGVMVGASSNDAASASTEGMSSEAYICPQGFNGMYKMMLRRVWGKPTVDRVTVDYYTHRGTPQEKHSRKVVSLVNGEASAAFELQKGRRTDPLEQEQVANAIAGQVAVGKAILAQQLGNVNNTAGSNNALTDFLAGASTGLFGLRGAVGYQPVIITLPTGTNFNTTVVVSADRRYVRVTSVPFFSSVPVVNTFNYAAGTGGTSGGSTSGFGS